MVSRRQFLQYGVAAGLVVTPTTKRVARATDEGWIEAWCDLTDKSTAVTAAQVETASPARFSTPLPIPRVLEAADADGERDLYRITARYAEREVVPGTTTRIWGYEGEWPGPTIVARRGRLVTVEHRNELDIGTSVHLHGAHTSPDSDGHPNDVIRPGAVKTYRYPNDQPTATLWYHDHIHHGTARSVYHGLAAFYLLTDPEEESLGLPSGERDIPLVIQDRTFTADGSLLYPEGQTNGFFGETICVNGAPWPYLAADQARYRLRILNGSNARQYRLSLSNGAPLTLIGTDGGLLPASTEVPYVEVSPAERVEVVVDLSGVPVGTRVVLRNERGDGALADVLAFDVVTAAGDTSRVPTSLRAVPALGAASVVRDVSLTLEDGVWVIDGKPFDPLRVDEFPKLGATEEWRITAPVDRSPMPHPFHIHLVMFQVLDRNGAAPAPWERGWKDTVTVAPGDTVRLKARFGSFTGTFVYHCHNLEHEDHDMMAQFKVVDLPRLAGEGRIETAAAIADATFQPGVEVVYVATAVTFPDALAAGPVTGTSETSRGPILLTSGPTLPTATRDAIERLSPKRIVVLGGTSAVPGSIERELERYAPVDRIAGATRYATAAAISAAHFERAERVYVATGESFADALAGGAAAADQGVPLLLVQRDAVPDHTTRELRRLRPSQIVVLGGASAVSSAVERELRSFAGNVRRIAGQTRYATAAAVSRAMFPQAVVAYVATGTGFADALAGVPAAREERAPLLLVAPEGIPDVVRDELVRLSPRRIVILGGPTAVSAEIENRLAQLLPDNVQIVV